MMKISKLVMTACCAILTVSLLGACNSRGSNSSEDYHNNDMERMDTHNTASDRGMNGKGYRDK